MARFKPFSPSSNILLAKDAILRRIPTEILSEIFTFTLPPHHTTEEPAPWTIGAVCSHWRQIVISQPRFWVFIDLRYFNRKKFTSKFRLETQLSRSSGLPLKVTFTKFNRTLSSEESSLLRLITLHARRWETLFLMGPKVLFTHLHGLINEPLTLLRVLDIEMEDGRVDRQDDDAAVPLLVTFKDAPRLQQVTCNKMYHRFPLSLALPWSQVLRFRGNNKWDGHLHTLRCTTDLVSCALQIPPETEAFTIPKKPISLPHLRRLSLQEAAILECLETPALQELYCPYERALLRFIPRQHQLRKLVIQVPASILRLSRHNDADPADLTRMLEAAATVTTLALMLPPSAAFVRDFSNLDMLSALECLLTWHITGEDNFELQNEFMHAVELRWQHGRLRAVKMSNGSLPSRWAPGILDRIELLRSQGMEFVVKSLSKIKDEIGPDF